MYQRSMRNNWNKSENKWLDISHVDTEQKCKNNFAETANKLVEPELVVLVIDNTKADRVS
jgi:hypothetical protein